MASPSSMSHRCFYCNALTDSDRLISGWKLRKGGYAMLCRICGTTYRDGRFCHTFHPDATGWRECTYCRKRVHCGCIMASQTFTILDFGGVQCLNCAVNEAWACSPEIGPLQHMLQATDSPQVPSADPEKTITGVYPIKPPGCVVRNDSPNEVSIPTTPGFEPQAQSPLEEIEEEDSVNSPAETKRSRRKNGGKRRKRTHNHTQVQYRYAPKTTPAELREICRESKSSLVPLFSKELTVSDADMRNGRLVLPKRCAEVYFPNISGQQGIFLMVQDTKGNDWELYFHYWSNSNGKMYLLEGLKDYMVLMKWEVGDTVTFYKREEDGKLFMGFKKYQAPNVVLKLHWCQRRIHGQMKDVLTS